MMWPSNSWWVRWTGWSCSGSRAYDLAVRLELAGFDRGHMIIEDDNSKLREAMKRSEGTIWVLAASAFGDEDGILEVLR